MTLSTPPLPAPSETAAAQPRPAGRATAVILGVAAVQIVLFVILVGNNGVWGYFSDEFYHIACSERLAWGYVDHPPLTVALLALIRAVFGEAVWAMRLGPILATAGVIVLTGLMARRLGAGTFGQGLAALAAAVTPWYLIPASTWTLNSFDALFWALGAYVIIGILKNDDSKGWLVFGAIAGLGLLTKLSMGYLLIGLCLALVLTPNRKYFLSKVDGKLRLGWHLWGGVALALLIFLPHLVWQSLNGWPTVEFARGSNAAFGTSPLGFLVDQVRGMNPISLPIWLTGLYFYLGSTHGRQYRVMGLIYVVLFTLMIVGHAKSYYLAAAYPMLLAGGALFIESFVEGGKWRGRILKPLYVTVLVGVVAIFSPLMLPVLPPKQVLAYQERFGTPADEAEVPAILYDRLGWEEFVAQIAGVYETLPEEDRKECVILGGTYNQAASVDFLGKKHGLPPAVSYHNNYYLWGPGDASWDVVIAVLVPKKMLDDMFAEVVEAGRTSAEFTRSSDLDNKARNDEPIYICRKPKRPIAEIWAEWKLFM